MNFQFAALIATFVNMKKKMAIKIAESMIVKYF